MVNYRDHLVLGVAVGVSPAWFLNAICQPAAGGQPSLLNEPKANGFDKVQLQGKAADGLRRYFRSFAVTLLSRQSCKPLALPACSDLLSRVARQSLVSPPCHRLQGGWRRQKYPVVNQSLQNEAEPRSIRPKSCEFV
jgi:hypothetical protein